MQVFSNNLGVELVVQDTGGLQEEYHHDPGDHRQSHLLDPGQQLY